MHKNLFGKEIYRYDLSNALPSPCTIEMASTPDAAVEKIVTASETEIVTSAPNPFNVDFSFRINSTDQTQARLNVYSIDGRLVESIALPCNATHQLGQNWPPGFYLLSIRIGDTSTSRKVIKR